MERFEACAPLVSSYLPSIRLSSKERHFCTIAKACSVICLILMLQEAHTFPVAFGQRYQKKYC